MKVLAFNGSPRKTWNTATLLGKALEGAAAQGAETELIHLYTLDYKGCISCFACKTKGGKSYGKCIVSDDLAPIFKKVEEADALILGSPVYLGRVTGEMASFLDRLLFQYIMYTDPLQSLFPKRIPTAFVYTMNATGDQEVREYGFESHFLFNEMILKNVFGSSETITSFDTLQVTDYSKIVASKFDPVQKAKRREEEFPKDCRKAFEMGSRLATMQL